MTNVRMPRTLAVVTVGPLCVAFVIVVGFVAGELVGYSPLRYAPPQNIAEAAALATASDVLRRLREGEDPNAILQVRPEVISSNVTRVSAVEAAMWGRTIELIRLLDREGAIGNGERRAHLMCLSEALQTQDILAYLAPQGASGCQPAATMDAIESRSR